MSAQPLEVRMAHLEGAYEQISDRLNGVDRRLENLEHKVDTRFDTLERRFDTLDRKVDGRFDTLDRKIDSRSAQFLAITMTSWVTIILAVFFHR